MKTRRCEKKRERTRRRKEGWRERGGEVLHRGMGREKDERRKRR